MTRRTDAFALDRVVDRVRAYGPDLVRNRGSRPASTALVLHGHDEDGPRALFMQRTTRAGDRWSGQMALPGGRRDPGDESLEATARRETSEEVGVELGAPIGRLDDQGTRASGIVVATYVYTVDEEPEIVPDPVEVDSTVWIPVRVLVDPEHARRYPVPHLGPFPAIEYEGYTVWGLTHRIVTHFLTVIEARP